MVESTATASGGSALNYGVYDQSGGGPTLFGGIFIQDSLIDGLYISSNSRSARIVNNQIIGSVTDNANSYTNCLGNYDETLNPVSCNDP